jgi:TetR/AcrR family transcriptional regulator
LKANTTAHALNGEVAESQATPTPIALRQSVTDLGPRAQRTIARILDATREVFLTRGYAGTTIDEISRIADISRASFYTYFASKREVLLAVGAVSADQGEAMIERLRDHVGKRSALKTWVAEYFDLLDYHGSFAFAWTQAALEDDEIRVAGMKRHLSMCRRLGDVLVSNTTPLADSTALGVIGFSLLERAWNYSQLYADTVDRDELIRQVAIALWGAARQPATI